MKQDLERYCKIKNNNLRFWVVWVSKFVSWWVFEFVSFSVFWVSKLVSFWVCELVSLLFRLFFDFTRYKREVESRQVAPSRVYRFREGASWYAYTLWMRGYWWALPAWLDPSLEGSAHWEIPLWASKILLFLSKTKSRPQRESDILHRDDELLSHHPQRCWRRLQPRPQREVTSPKDEYSPSCDSWYSSIQRYVRSSRPPSKASIPPGRTHEITIV